MTPAEFRALKPRQAVNVGLKTTWGDFEERRLYVGRRSKSRRYRRETVSLTTEPGKAGPAHLRNLSRITLNLRGDSITAAVGDMAATLTKFEVIK